MTPMMIFLSMMVATIVTFGLRLFPYVMFRHHDVLPPRLQFIAQVLPKAIMTTLVIYCVKDVAWTQAPFGAAELISIVCVVVLHWWKQNTLLSIFVPTMIYMILIQVVFV